MITGSEFYKVMCAMAPLYFAMFVAYGSVKWWKIFTAEQCSGINRFVSVFAVPILSFHFISQNNPYKMDMMFIIADTLSKVMVFVLLSLWAILFKSGGLDWLITLFSVATLPNTLVMGIPLLQAMYGEYTQNLMVQLVVLQCIIWYTLLLFLFELRAARLLIRTEFPGQAAGAITRIQVDDDVISLDGMDPLRTETETDINGRVRLRIRRSISSVPDSVVSSSLCLTPRASNLSNAEIFSVNTPNPKKFGVTEFVNPKEHDKPVQQVIAEMTNGGVDRSVECTGSIQAMIQAFECVHDGWGVAVLVGVPSKDDAFKTHPMNLLNERTLKGTFFGNYKPKTDIPGVVEKYMNKELELEKFITHTLPFSEINKAFDYMLKGEGIRCIITMGA
ncbi:hypothetical protein DY000_02064142 [Brassica cretica]|uniref:Alcohol dehydrogenase-like C-terminal domain-containing protein n=1 Tax=Brassica cretica TaxID=69181 RepID=A0ABQ7AZI1_BRACR|nr:hypothetical protein DY000_02064142 [Brassica cretica]